MKKERIPYKLLFYISLIVVIIFFAAILMLLIRGNYFSMLKKSVSDPEYHYQSNASYPQRQTQFEMMPERSADVVFLGDSITARFEWQEYFSDLSVANRGIDSDVCEGVYNRLDTVISQNPKKIFIMIGINDVVHKIDPDRTMDYYQKIVQTLRQELPDARIYLQSVLPVNRATGIDNNRVHALNEKIKELADANSLIYIDLYSKVVTDDNDFTYTVDGVHPTGDGYRIWVDAISGYVYEE